MNLLFVLLWIISYWGTNRYSGLTLITMRLRPLGGVQVLFFKWAELWLYKSKHEDELKWKKYLSFNEKKLPPRRSDIQMTQKESQKRIGLS